MSSLSHNFPRNTIHPRVNSQTFQTSSSLLYKQAQKTGEVALASRIFNSDYK